MEPLRKIPSGIVGLDNILDGGLPQGRPILLRGSPGSGKTLLGMEFLCRGALQYDQPGLFVSFEESSQDIQTNFAASEFGFREAIEQGRVTIDCLPLVPQYIFESGDFTFDGLLVRLEGLLEETGAQRLVLDSLNSLCSRFSDSINLRVEYSRIFQWVKEKGLTALVTSERDEVVTTFSRLEEYLADCVIYLDHRISNQISKRRLLVIKYRGSSHGTDEYPLLLTDKGLSIIPITSLELSEIQETGYVSTGITELDAMLDGRGIYKGSSLLISGGPGTGKSTVAASAAKAVCREGGKSLYLSFEESVSQIVRNMASVGLDLQKEIDKGLLLIKPIRPGRHGLEEHLVRVHSIIDEIKPDMVVVDPITSFGSIGERLEIKSMLTRLLDYVRACGITLVMTSLTSGSGREEESETEVSSLVDTWIIIRFGWQEAERMRRIYIHKARGMAHSQKVMKLEFSVSGISIKNIEGSIGRSGIDK